MVLGNRRQLVEEASLAINWKKRLKDHNTRFVELHTKFMFNKSWKRKQRNYIYMLKNENSIWVDDAQEIELLITKHFQDIYIPNSTLVNDSTQHGEDIYLVLWELHLPTISDEEYFSLQAPFTPQEIKSAMFDIDQDKSPSMQGFLSEFFKLYWDNVGHLVVEAVNKFFSTWYLLKDWNRTLLVLIPKVTPPEEVSHLRL